MNKKCVALTNEEYERVIDLLRNGFVYKEHMIRPNGTNSYYSYS